MQISKILKPIDPLALDCIPVPQMAYLVDGKFNAQKGNAIARASAIEQGIFSGVPGKVLAKFNSSTEAYAVLLSGNGGSVIVADNPRTVTYAESTLKQMGNYSSSIPEKRSLLVIDWPAIPIRACIRTQLVIEREQKKGSISYYEKGLGGIEDLLDRMNSLKLNTFFLHSAWGSGIDELLTNDNRRAVSVDRLVKAATRRNIDFGLLLSHSMEVDDAVTGRNPNGRLKRKYACAYDPAIRRKRYEIFETLLTAYPEVKYILIHSDEKQRCNCEKCKSHSRGDEFIEYLADYHRIIREKRPDIILAVCPYTQIGYPYYHINEYVKKKLWEKVGDNTRTVWWTENYPVQELPQFLLNSEQTIDAYIWKSVPRVWHWFYMNGWTDFTFPASDHFCSFIRHARSTGNLEAASGEQSFYRASEWNIRALAQFSWNSDVDPEDFDALIVKTFFPQLSVAKGLKIINEYRRLLTLFLTALSHKGYTWKNRNNPEVITDFMSVLSGLKKLRREIPAKDAGIDRNAAITLVDLRRDLDILELEIGIRIKLRQSYMAWQNAETFYVKGKKAQGNVRMGRSILLLKESKKDWQLLRKTRNERGNLHDNYNAAPMSKMERVFDGLLKLTSIVLDLRKKGFNGARPHWNEWAEFHNLWRRYDTFH